MNRREFITNSAAIVGSSAIASPIKSFIGSAETGWIIQKDIVIPTPNEYVQDGLVAMWDGQFNDINEYGEMYHNPSTSEWKDLTKNRFDLVTMASSRPDWFPHFGENYAAFNGTRLTSTGEYVFSGSNDSIEMITDGSQPVAGNGGNRGIIGINAASVYNATIGYRLAGNTIYGFSSGQFNTGMTGICRFTAVRDGNSIIFYRDGCIVKSATITASSVTGNTIIAGGFFSGDTQTSIVCKVYSIRIYNRALTASEVRWNYKVDQARFGI